MLMNLFPRWLVIAVISAVALEQFAIRLPDVLLAWDTYWLKIAQIHGGTQTPDGHPQTAEERKAEAEAEKAEADARAARAEACAKIMSMQDLMTGKPCPLDKPGDRSRSHAISLAPDATMLTAYHTTRDSLEGISGWDLSHEESSMDTACVTGVSTAVRGQMTEEEGKQVLWDAPCRSVIKSFKAKEKGIPIVGCIGDDNAYTTKLACSCVSGGSFGMSRIDFDNDADKASFTSQVLKQCRHLSRIFAIYDEQHPYSPPPVTTPDQSTPGKTSLADAKITDTSPQQFPKQDLPAQTPTVMSPSSQSAPQPYQQPVAPTQQAMVTPLPKAPQSTGNLLEVMAANTWGLGSSLGCRSVNTLQLAIRGDSIIWRDTTAQDIEHVIGVSSTEAGTITIQSQHPNGKQEPVGTQWIYTAIGGDRVRVTRNRIPAFDLVKC